VVRTANLDRAIKEYEEALKVMGRKDYAKAAHLFEAIIKEFSAEREVCDRSRVYLSVCRRHAGGSAQKARASDDPYYLGVIAANDGRLDEAVDLFEKTLRQDPRSDRALYALASICGMRQDVTGAVDHLRKAIDLNPANKVYALNDSDFDPLRGDVEFMGLLGRDPEGSE
jgi:tetratricopeptide (TPR) repeat protein